MNKLAISPLNQLTPTVNNAEILVTDDGKEYVPIELARELETKWRLERGCYNCVYNLSGIMTGEQLWRYKECKQGCMLSDNTSVEYRHTTAGEAGQHGGYVVFTLGA